MKNKVKNPFHYLHSKSPRAWAIVVLPFMILVTAVVAPLAWCYEVLIGILQNVWDAVYGIVGLPVVFHTKKLCHIVSVPWCNWWRTLMGRNVLIGENDLQNALDNNSMTFIE